MSAAAKQSEVHALKCSPAWQLAQWAKWPDEAMWPGVMDLYLAAAFCGVCPATIRRACIPGRDGRALLAHQRFGAKYIIRKASLLAFGKVQARSDEPVLRSSSYAGRRCAPEVAA